VDPKYFRATEVDILQGDATKARTVLGWKPRWSFKCLIEDMVAADRAVAFAERGISLYDQQ
jgi:GDPmannose 4,6-dehydratase